MKTVVALPGEGIGPEVVDATCEVLYADGIPIYGSLANVDAVHCIMVLTARQALWMEGLSTLGFE